MTTLQVRGEVGRMAQSVHWRIGDNLVKRERGRNDLSPSRIIRSPGSSDAGLLEVTRSSHKKIGDAAFVNYAPIITR